MAGLLVAHQLALTLVHYAAGPALGWRPTSPALIATTVILAAAAIGGLVAIDLQ